MMRHAIESTVTFSHIGLPSCFVDRPPSQLPNLARVKVTSCSSPAAICV